MRRAGLLLLLLAVAATGVSGVHHEQDQDSEGPLQPAIVLDSFRPRIVPRGALSQLNPPTPTAAPVAVSVPSVPTPAVPEVPTSAVAVPAAASPSAPVIPPVATGAARPLLKSSAPSAALKAAVAVSEKCASAATALRAQALSTAKSVTPIKAGERLTVVTAPPSTATFTSVKTSAGKAGFVPTQLLKACPPASKPKSPAVKPQAAKPAKKPSGPKRPAPKKPSSSQQKTKSKPQSANSISKQKRKPTAPASKSKKMSKQKTKPRDIFKSKQKSKQKSKDSKQKAKDSKQKAKDSKLKSKDSKNSKSLQDFLNKSNTPVSRYDPDAKIASPWPTPVPISPQRWCADGEVNIRTRYESSCPARFTYAHPPVTFHHMKARSGAGLVSHQNAPG
jgi:hypothetical protein